MANNRSGKEDSGTKKFFRPILAFFKEYSASTTFHGFTYIFNAVTIGGKLIWFVIFTLALSAFIYQVYDRVSFYLQRPVNVDISIIIKDTVEFPAITICNTNAYKISTAFEKRLYRNLTEFYQLDESEKPDFPGLNGYDSIELMTSLGHTKQDMIKQCYWLGKPCGPDNFTISMTDYGPCFTFNNHIDARRLTVSNTGASYGLELLLNIEQYENMAGPHKAAGIKVLPHEPSEVPRIQDLGISVPASMTAMLGLSLAESKHLSPPHGECGTYPLKHQNIYSKSACEAECYASVLEEACGCVHFSMNGTRVCSLTQQYGCVLRTMEQARRQGTCSSKQRCPLPCLERLYSADISYSATSHFETIKLASYYKAKDPEMYFKFINGTLVKHSALPELYTQEEQLIAESYEHITSMNTTVLEMKEQMEQWKQYLSDNIEITLTKLLNQMQESVNYLRNMYDKEFRLTKHRMFLTIFLYKVDYVLAVAKQHQKYVNPFVDAGNVGTETQTCNYFFRNMLDDLESIVYALADTYDVYNRQYNTFTPTSRIDDPVVRNWFDEVRRFGSTYLRQLIVLKNMTQDFKKSAYDLCGRMAQFQFLSVNVKAQLVNDMIFKATEMKQEVESTASNLRDLLEKLQVYEADVGVIKGYVNQYAYSVKIRLHGSNKAVEDIVTFLNRLLPNIERLHHKFEDGEVPTKLHVLEEMKKVVSSSSGSHGLVEQFDEMFHKVISECEQMSQAMLILHDVLEGAFNGLRLHHRGGFMERFDYLSGNISVGNYYFHEMTDKLQHFEGSGEVFRASVNQLMKRLNEFNSTLDIDEKFIKNNFMRLHVYYTSLSFHTVDKHAAYLWFSLLCDVGGAAGLLLGASALSILEIIYFIGKCCFPAKKPEVDVESCSLDSLSRQQYKEIKKANRDHIKKLMNQNGHTYL